MTVAIVHQHEDPEVEAVTAETVEIVELLYQNPATKPTPKMLMIKKREDLYDLDGIAVIDQDVVIAEIEMIAIVGIAETGAIDDVDQAGTEMIVDIDHDHDLVLDHAIGEEVIEVEVVTESRLERRIARSARQQTDHLLIPSCGSLRRPRRENKKRKPTLLHRMRLVLRACQSLDGLTELLLSQPLQDMVVPIELRARCH